METREDFTIARLGENKIRVAFNTCGWYIHLDNTDLCLHKDLMLRETTGWSKGDYKWGEAPGYYASKELAEQYLDAYLIKQKTKALIDERAWEMLDKKIKITVEVDGKEVPLDTISTETFEKIKAAAKEPEYEGVYVGDCADESRVFFVVTDTICKYKGEVIALNSKGNKVAGGHGTTFLQLCTRLEYSNIRKLGT